MPLNRKQLIQQHNPSVKAYDPDSFLSIGNGEFAFTSDCTGLQTVLPSEKGKTPLCTMSNWGMHSYAGKENPNYEALKLRHYQSGDRSVGYMTDSTGQQTLFDDLRQNPHRLNLGRIAFTLEGVSEAEFLQHLTDIHQELDLYTGILTSSFSLDGRSVCVTTLCNPDTDQLAIKVQSALLKTKQLTIQISFPYASHAMDASDWANTSIHHSTLVALGNGDYVIERVLDKFQYRVDIQHSDAQVFALDGCHTFGLQATSDSMTACIGFHPDEELLFLPSYHDSQNACQKHWKDFWENSAFVDLSQSNDGRWFELQRRMFLSRYLLAIQCSGSTPPPETGLTCNSWYGKFHVEMHLLHAAHFALWGQPQLLERSLPWYLTILDKAYERAHSQGYKGARWPKMTSPAGDDSPSSIGTLLCWQQPHPIFYGVLIKKTDPKSKLLEKWTQIIGATADFMADYVQWDEKTKTYGLGSPVIPVQENHDPEDTVNPTFELSYWRWGLEEAVKWMKAEQKPIPAKWIEVLDKLAPLPMQDGLYLAQQNCPGTYTTYNTDHPSLLFSLGLLDGRDVDRVVMKASLEKVLSDWDLNSLWGWDFPLMSMTAARLGMRKEAIDLLLLDSPKNTYTANGHNEQLPKEELPLYLPGNGALLLALALLCAGWEGSEEACPGFPNDGSWILRTEGFEQIL